jgi:hypothetical protein
LELLRGGNQWYKCNRGKATCGDIDILMSREDGKPFAGFLSRVVKAYNS